MASSADQLSLQTAHQKPSEGSKEKDETRVQLKIRSAENGFILDALDTFRAKRLPEIEWLKKLILAMCQDPEIVPVQNQKKISDEIEACFKKTKDEIDEIEKILMSVIAHSDFLSLYSKVKILIQKREAFKLEEFMCPPSLASCLEKQPGLKEKFVAKRNDRGGKS